MGNLNELANKIANTKGALKQISAQFFSQDYVKDAIITEVQRQSINGLWSDDTNKPEYAEYTYAKREENDYTPWSTGYTGHESGALFRSMDVFVEEDSFKIISEEGWGRGMDILNETRFGEGGPGHIQWYFDLYDEEGKTLGLTPQKLVSLLEQLQFKDFVQNEFKTYMQSGLSYGSHNTDSYVPNEFE